MSNETELKELEKSIAEMQNRVAEIKSAPGVWTPKDGEWRLSLSLKPYIADDIEEALTLLHYATSSAGGFTGVDASYATAEDALAAVPLRYNQQLLEAYKREFDPTFKPKFDGSQKNYSLAYTKRDRTKVEWVVKYNKWHGDPQLTYFSKEACQILCEKVNNGTVVLELGT